MMMQRFTKEELWKVRNEISVQMVIEAMLRIEGKIIEGVYRFLCPVCKEFQTGIHHKTNLSRCFRCQRNFNTIDLVMLVRKLSFVQSVKFLQAQFTSLKQCCASQEISSSNAFVEKLVSSLCEKTNLSKVFSGKEHLMQQGTHVPKLSGQGLLC